MAKYLIEVDDADMALFRRCLVGTTGSGFTADEMPAYREAQGRLVWAVTDSAAAVDLTRWIEERSGAHQDNGEDRGKAAVEDYEVVDAYHDGYMLALSDLGKLINPEEA